MSYRYRHYRYRRHRYRYRRYGQKLEPWQKAAIVLVVAMAVTSGTSKAVTGRWFPGGRWKPAPAAVRAIHFAKAQSGCPYVWGGTGPCSSGFDCSGLVLMAYQSAGVNTLPRTSEEQWASLHHIQPGRQKPGDLVFFAGADGTPTSPGHVGIVLGRHTMVDAYSTGFPVTTESYGLPSSRQGLSDPVGFARPVPLVRGAASRKGYTVTTWAQTLLAADRKPQTRCNRAAIEAWEGAEGGNWNNQAAFNPLNTAKTMPGSHGVVYTGTPGIWVQAFTSWNQGLRATLIVLHHPQYAAVQSALSAGNSAQAVADAVASSPWGTSSFSVSC